MVRRIKQRFLTLIGLLCALAFGQASAQIAGAIFTTTIDGTTVNGNIYDSKDAVYLNGGPQNPNGSLIVPDGTYYFQVTDPSGSVLLSSDPAVCRQVTVSSGRIIGPTGPSLCAHSPGYFDSANGTTPVQLIPYDDTPNPGGEYKVWLISQAPSCQTTIDSNDPRVLLFSDNCSKTDNFKVKTPGVAYILGCKFNDVVGDGSYRTSDPPLSAWPMTFQGVVAGGKKNGTVNTLTGTDGCTEYYSVSVNNNSNGNVTVTEATLDSWQATGVYILVNGGAPTSGTAPYSSTSVKLSDGDIAEVDFFNASSGTRPPSLSVSKTANPGNMITWGIEKSVDTTQVNSSTGSATFNYTVNVTHDTGSGWQVQGQITVANPTGNDFTGVNVTDAATDSSKSPYGSCTISQTSTGLTVPANGHITLDYTCTFPGDANNPPSDGTNTATVMWPDVPAGCPSGATGPCTQTGGTTSNTADFTFVGAVVDGCVAVTDTLGGNLGNVCYTDPSPKTFSYPFSFMGDPAGTCTSHKNTATFTTDDTGTTGSASQTVKQCVGADLTVSKTATPTYTRTYNWSITKSVDKTLVEIAGGTATFNYTVVASETGFTDSGWQVTGKITVSNPNDWEAITANLTDAVDNGGACTVNAGTNVVLAASSSQMLNYTCTYSSAPNPAGFTNTATATWDKAAASTSNASKTGTATGSFSTPTTFVNQKITVTDTFDGAKTTLGTLTATDTAPFATASYMYSHVISAPAGGACLPHNNTAVIAETGQNAGQPVNVCNTKTGALTMGFWQNKIGQGVIAADATCSAGLLPLLAANAAFSASPSDVPLPTACGKNNATVTTWVNAIITAANSAGSGIPMLRGQMLATLLTTYYSANSTIKAQGTLLTSGTWILLNYIKGSEDVRPAFTSFKTSAPHLWGEQVSDMLEDSAANWTASACAYTTTNKTWNCTKAPYSNKQNVVYGSDAFSYINQSQANISAF